MRRSVTELNKYTTTAYAFSKDEQRDGVVVEEGSKTEALWDLLAQTNPALIDPTTLQEIPPIESFAYSTALMCEKEIRLHAEHQAVLDRIKFIDEKRRQGLPLPDMNRNLLVLKSDIIFKDWDSTRARCKRMEETYIIYRQDRLERLRSALELYRELHSDVADGSAPELSWVPDKAFAAALVEQVNTLKLGLQMTAYFKVQNCVAGITGRPLFSPSEFTVDLKLRLDKDPYHRSRIKGSVVHRFQLVSLAY